MNNIKRVPMKFLAKSLRDKFAANGLKHLLPRIDERTLALLADYPTARGQQRKHLLDILPCIAFYEVLIEREGDRKKAFAICREWSLSDMEKSARVYQALMKLPGMYRLAPKIFDTLIDRIYGIEAGFVSPKVPGQKGFARNTIICPYLSACVKYGYPELTTIFCDSDDICYENMHPKLVWARTKTMGHGGDCCDFRLYVDESRDAAKLRIGK